MFGVNIQHVSGIKQREHKMHFIIIDLVYNGLHTSHFIFSAVKGKYFIYKYSQLPASNLVGISCNGNFLIIPIYVNQLSVFELKILNKKFHILQTMLEHKLNIMWIRYRLPASV